ncbi:MAG: thiamine phosphate synthase [Actinobacteria bacterium]|nr:thiamine phosphate synthase [Actinomycetota bacterium]
MPVDYTLYLVTDRGILKGKDLFSAVEEAIAGGVTLVQLREKDISSLDFYNIALKLREVTKYHGVPLIINDRLDIALAADADGLHVGQEDLPVRDARRLLGEDKILGYSVTTIEEAVFGQTNGADYLGAGPVYPTGSKADAAPPIGIDQLKRIKDSVSLPVVAIGGIGAANIKEIKASGVDGVSLISAILGSNDIKEASGRLVELWTK